LLEPPQRRALRLRANGREYERQVEVWKNLADFVREDLGLTGTHVGCEHGVCGTCTILVNGEPVRSCLMLAVQANNAELVTVEGLAEEGRLHPLQQAFQAHHGLQCGYCTPGILMTTVAFLREVPRPDEREIREMLAGNLCRCTGYQFIVEAIQAAAAEMTPSARSQGPGVGSQGSRP
jgi:aerobic-type carbon monoxide dehydrogenase small subunit (CoxS/CutS family)